MTELEPVANFTELLAYLALCLVLFCTSLNWMMDSSFRLKNIIELLISFHEKAIMIQLHNVKIGHFYKTKLDK